MPDTLRRVTVHAAGLPGGRTDSETDLMLPAGCPLGVLMPAIVDEVVGAAGAGPLHWRLSRVGGRELDTAISLGEQDVGDGALLLLSTVNSTAPQRTHRDPAGAVAAAAERSAAALHDMAPWAVAAFGVISAAILVWSGTAAATATHPWVAGGLSAGTAAAALTAARSGLRPAAPLGSSAVVFAVAAGLLAVPHSPWAATLLLAAAAGLAVSTTMLRTACRGSAALCALATLTGGLAAVSALCTVSGAPIATAGAVLVVLALAGLSVAARLTVAAAGLGPMCGEVDDTRAAVAHGVLTGLVTGFAGAAALGVGAVAVSGVLGSSWTVPALFAADVGLLLLLRLRTHVDPRRRLALAGAGGMALAAAGAVVVATAPGQAHWVATAVAGAGVAAAWRPGRAPNPAVQQLIHAIEYGSLAALVPLAAWICGVYGLVGELGLR